MTARSLPASSAGASPPPDSTPTAAEKFLTFELDGERYAVDILLVQEIIRMPPVTRVPGAAPHVRGVTNLRGRITPVLDARRKLGLTPAVDTSQTCVIVVDTGKDTDGGVLAGLVVDEVSEVVDVPASEIQATPDLGRGSAPGYLTGMAKVGERVVIFLDLREVLSDPDVVDLGPLGEEIRAVTEAGESEAGESGPVLVAEPEEVER